MVIQPTRYVVFTISCSTANISSELNDTKGLVDIFLFFFYLDKILYSILVNDEIYFREDLYLQWVDEPRTPLFLIIQILAFKTVIKCLLVRSNSSMGESVQDSRAISLSLPRNRGIDDKIKLRKKTVNQAKKDYRVAHSIQNLIHRI